MMKRSNIVIVILSVLLICSFVVICVYEKKLSSAYTALISLSAYNQQVIKDIYTLGDQVSKLNELVVYPSDNKELVIYAKDISDLILTMDRKLLLSSPQEGDDVE